MILIRTILFGVVVIPAMLFSGCKDTVSPPLDNPPVIIIFVVHPASIKPGGSTTFNLLTTDNKSIDRVILNYGDGTADMIEAIAQPSFSFTKTKKYNTLGVKTATLYVFDNDNQNAIATLEVGVYVVLPPVFDKTSLAGVEGLTTAYAKKDIAHDPDGLAMTLNVVSFDPNLSVVETADSIKVGGKDPNVNGSYIIQMKADNGSTAAVQYVVAVLASRDDVSGKIRDILEGTYVAGLYPELVMKGPFTGWIAMVSGKDSIRIPINSDGTFKFPKVVPGPHRVYRFATNGVDSSFSAYDDFTAGDRVVDAFVHTNAGTDNTVPGTIKPLPLKDLQDLYKAGNVGSFSIGVLRGMDLTKENTFYLAGKDIVRREVYDHLYKGMTPAQQDSVESVINEWRAIFPPDVQARLIVYKAPQGEDVPFVIHPVNGLPRPPPQMGWVFVDNAAAGDGNFQYWANLRGYEVTESAIMTYCDESSLSSQKIVQRQQIGAWFCAPLDVYVSTLNGKSVFSEKDTAPFITNADKKFAWLVFQVKLGTPMRQYFSLSN